jgi:hypothetical protein
MTKTEKRRLKKEEREAAIAEFGEIPISREEMEETVGDQESYRELIRDERSRKDIINSDEY